MKLLQTRAELKAARDAMPGTVGVVLTMGALHEGHASLLRIARARADRLLMTIFVNPLQFGPNEDFDRYPRTLKKDLEIAAAEGVDAVFAPTREEVYPGGEPSVQVNPGPLGGAGPVPGTACRGGRAQCRRGRGHRRGGAARRPGRGRR